MASGIKGSANRPKLGKNLRSTQKKRFRNENTESLKKYREKLMKRADRKVKKRNRRK